MCKGRLLERIARGLRRYGPLFQRLESNVHGYVLESYLAFLATGDDQATVGFDTSPRGR